MKLNIAALLIALLSLLLSFFLLYKINSLSREKDPTVNRPGKEVNNGAETKKENETMEEENEDVEIVHYMQRIQSFHAKLYYSGRENNKDLIRFYADEIKEEMEFIAKADIFDEGINISENMKLWGIRNINKFIEEIPSPEFNFRNSYTNLTNACNSCHQATRHPFIQITEPAIASPYNQDFKPVK